MCFLEMRLEVLTVNSAQQAASSPAAVHIHKESSDDHGNCCSFGRPTN